MSYDGGLVVKISNPMLLKVLKSYAEDLEVDMDCFSAYKGYDFSYEYLDCAYVSGCPESLEDLRDYILELVENYSDNYEAFKKFAEYFKDNYSQIKREYSYVRWEYYPESEGYDLPDEEVFEYGEDTNC